VSSSKKNDKTKTPFDLFSTVKCTLPPFEDTPPNTYRQQITLPLKKGKNVKVEKKVVPEKETEEKEQKPATLEKGSTSPQRVASTSSSTSPWIPKKREVPLIPISEDEIEEKDPVEFCCPISRSVMTDPVIASDGQTYERESIERWLKESNTSPITREKMVNTDLEPNIKLKGEIEIWQKKKDQVITKSSRKKKQKVIQPQSPNGNPRHSKSERTPPIKQLSKSKIEHSKSEKTPVNEQAQSVRQSRSEKTPVKEQASPSTVRHRKSEMPSSVKHRKSEMDENKDKLSSVRQRKSEMIIPEKQQEEQLTEIAQEEQQSPVRKRKVEVDPEDNLTEKEIRKKEQQHNMDDDEEDEEYAFITE